MDHEIIERVALAISGCVYPVNILAIHRSRAHAAIKAMREPTEKMIEAGRKIDTINLERDTYKAMIDSIFND